MRSHKNTTRLTAKERANRVMAHSLAPYKYEDLPWLIERAIQAAVRQALARKKRRK